LGDFTLAEGGGEEEYLWQICDVCSAPEFVRLTFFADVKGLTCNSVDSIMYVLRIDNPRMITAIKVNNIEPPFLLLIFFF
jgi:hypothetical protein